MLQEKIPPALAEAYRNMAYYPPLPGYLGDIIRIGDRYTVRTYLYGGGAHVPKGPLITGEVIYIHPNRRFFSVRFDFKGGTAFESFRTFIDEIIVYEEIRYSNNEELYSRYPLSEYERGYLTYVLNGDMFDDSSNADRKLERELQIILSESNSQHVENSNSGKSKTRPNSSIKPNVKRKNAYERFY